MNEMKRIKELEKKAMDYWRNNCFDEIIRVGLSKKEREEYEKLMEDNF